MDIHKEQQYTDHLDDEPAKSHIGLDWQVLEDIGIARLEQFEGNGEVMILED